ncbi:MAG: metal-sulfur cluster assembly factor [Ktedonobacterales bacterium]|nr:metal-sulfur cluster assembly factor [Ktedonobacterales bacterium]
MSALPPSGRANAGAGGPLGAEYPRGALWDALREVPDPEMGISLVDMGMIVAVEQVGAAALVRLTYTAMGCPATEMIEEDIRARLLAMAGVGEVRIEVVWDPIWSKARLTAEARDALLLSGVAL